MDKQIEEMAEVLKGMDRLDEARFGFYESYARALYTAGYRKSEEVAREIFEEIENALELHIESFTKFHITQKIAELKKKYTESENNNE